MADNSRMHMASTTAAAPATKHANTGHQQDERTAMEGNPPSSNSWVAMTPDAFPEEPRSVPMTKEDERHMKQLHRDPAELLTKQLDNQQQMDSRRQGYEAAAPGQNLDEMAAGDAVGINPSDAAAAAPRPTAEQMDSNRLTEDDKMADDPFVRKETAT